MKPNYPGAELCKDSVTVQGENENSASCVHVPHKTLNLVISRCSCAQNGKEMYQKVQHVYRVIGLLNRAFVLRRSRSLAVAVVFAQ